VIQRAEDRQATGGTMPSRRVKHPVHGHVVNGIIA
jgi:hypothetical protein